MLIILLVSGCTIPLQVKSQQVKAISFNIGGSEFTNGENNSEYSWARRKQAVINMINKEQPHIIALQEVVIEQMAVLDRQYLRTYRRLGAGSVNGLSKGEHEAIYYDFNRIELLKTRTIWVSPNIQTPSRGWDAEKNRIITMAKFRDKQTGKEFVWINTQLDATGTESRSEAMRFLMHYVDRYGGKDCPVILSGDMNSHIDIALFDPLYELGLVSARDIAVRTDYRNTYNAYGANRGSMNDHIMVRGISNILQFKTLIQNYGIRYISNHYPIEIIFEF